MLPTSFRSIHFVLKLTYSYRVGSFPGQLRIPLAVAKVVLFPVILGQHLTWQQAFSVFEGMEYTLSSLSVARVQISR
jgi:hypothetical protein